MKKPNQIQPLDAVVPPLVHRRSATQHQPPTETNSGLSVDEASNPLHLTRLQFALVWITYVSVSTLSAVLAMIFAAIYYGAHTIRGGYMIDSMGLLALENIPIVVACYAAMALVFFKLSLQAIAGTLCARRLVFTTSSKPRPTKDEMPESRLWRLYHAVTKRIDFEVAFLLREIVEVVTQSYQAYKCSTLISMAWINEFYVATLVINCWVAPIIHVRLHHNLPLQKFLYIASDVVLDFASTFVVPVSIISTIVLTAFQNNMATASGDMEYAFDVPMSDVAFINMVKAVQQVFVVTWLDVFTKLLPFTSMASCLVKIQRLVQPQPKHLKATQIAIRPRLSVTAMVKRRLSAVTDKKKDPPSHWTHHRLHCVFHVFAIHALFAVWGTCIVGFHLHAKQVAAASRVHHSMGCKTSSQPWFVDKFSCTMLEINCHRRGFTGYADEVASALGHVDANGVGALIISHCSSLYMPSQIHTLKNLMWLEVYNVTLVEWDKKSALVNSQLPALQFLNIIRVNMTELPPGLQSSQFPSRLRDITIAHSNLTTLPTDLHTKWTRMINLVLERNRLDAIPWTVSQMNPSRLSVFDNQITTIPADFFTQDANFWILSIARNPLAAWPETIGSLDRIYHVLIDYTEIAELPRWLADEGARRAREKISDLTVSAGGSPFCRQRLAHTIDASEQYAGLHIVCREKADHEMEAYMMEFYEPDRKP